MYVQLGQAKRKLRQECQAHRSSNLKKQLGRANRLLDEAIKDQRGL